MRIATLGSLLRIRKIHLMNELLKAIASIQPAESRDSLIYSIEVRQNSSSVSALSIMRYPIVDVSCGYTTSDTKKLAEALIETIIENCPSETRQFKEYQSLRQFLYTSTISATSLVARFSRRGAGNHIIASLPVFNILSTCIHEPWNWSIPMSLHVSEMLNDNEILASYVSVGSALDCGIKTVSYSDGSYEPCITPNWEGYYFLMRLDYDPNLIWTECGESSSS